MTRILLIVPVAASFLALGACENQPWNVKRVDPAKQTDLDYRFNDQDAREIFQQMSQDALSRPWIESWMRSHGDQRPIVYLASVKNNTQDYINSELFTNQIEENFINSGKVRLKVEHDARQELRNERMDTQFNDPATVKAVAKEINADFALMGSINDNKQRSPSGNTVVNYYQARMELVNVETAETVWTRTAEIKKVAHR
jgi:penicillin-binding protein activator